MEPEFDVTTGFVPHTEPIRSYINKVVSETLADKQYHPSNVQEWVDTITSSVIGRLTSLSEELKYVVSVIILEKKNGGFHLFSTCYWDQERDATITVRWENKSMHCVVTVLGVTIA